MKNKDKTNNFEVVKDHINHCMIVKFRGLTRELNYHQCSDKNIMNLVNEMLCELRDRKINEILK